MNTIINKTLLLLMAFAMGMQLHAQTTAYQCVLTNGTTEGSGSYRFDVYIHSMGTQNLPLTNYQLSFSLTGLGHSGVSCVYVEGSSELPGFAPTKVNVLTQADRTLIRVTGPFPSSASQDIPAGGLRVGTFRLITSGGFGPMPMNLSWSNQGPYHTRVYALLNGMPTAITDYPASHVLGTNLPIADATIGQVTVPNTGENSRDLAAGIDLPNTGQVQISNYPNPFDNSTVISFRLPVDEEVTLEVYDLTGKLQETLYKGAVRGGKTYREEFDGTILPAGIYIYRLTTGEEILTGKMILNRD